MRVCPLTCSAFLLLVLTGSAWSRPELRDRALVQAYESLAGNSSGKLAKAYEVISRSAPALLYDVDLQKAYWYATLKVSRGDPKDLRIAEGREDVLRAGKAEWLKDAVLRGAFRFFFERGEMRQKVEPHIGEVRPYLEELLATARIRSCLGLVRLAEAGRWLLLGQTGGSGESPADLLLREGLIPEDSQDCGEDPRSWRFSPEDGFHSPLAGSSKNPAVPPPLNWKDLQERAVGNPFLRALLDQLPSELPALAFDASLQEAMGDFTAQDWKQAEQKLAPIAQALEKIPGAAQARLRTLVFLIRSQGRQGEIASARKTLEVARKISSGGPAWAGLLLAEAELERELGNWDQAETLLKLAQKEVPGLSGESQELQFQILRELGRCALLQGDLNSEATYRGQALALVPDSFEALLGLGRVRLDLGDLPGAREMVSRIQAKVRGKTDAMARLGQAGSTLLELELVRLEGSQEKLAGLHARVLQEIEGVGLGQASEAGFGGWHLTRLAEVLRLRDRVSQAEECLVHASLAALRRGGSKNPELLQISQEKARVAKARESSLAAQTAVQGRIQEIQVLVKQKKFREALDQVKLARKQLPELQSLRAPLLGWLRYYQFQAAYLGGQFDEAYKVLLSREEREFELGTKHLAYMFSVGIELALRLSRPSLELVRWGSACIESCEKGEDLEGALRCARNAGSMLELKDEEHRATTFAEHLIRFGEQRSDPALILEGFELLSVGSYRSGKRRELSFMIPRLDGLLARFPLDANLITRRKKLLEVMTGKFRLESHAAARKAYLESGKTIR